MLRSGCNINNDHVINLIEVDISAQTKLNLMLRIQIFKTKGPFYLKYPVFKHPMVSIS